MDVSETLCGDHDTIYTNIESLWCAPKASIILYVNYTSVFKKKYFAGKESKTQKVYHEMSSPKIQTKNSEDSIFLKCISFLEVKLAGILFSKAENSNHQDAILFTTQF